MRIAAVLLALLWAAGALGERILLVPVDGRPAAGQFAEMIGKMASVEVLVPPAESLGRFTVPGDPEAILSWLESQITRDVSAVIVSTDMIGFGGLIASRSDETELSTAMERLRRLGRLRRRFPKIKFYVFSAIMRLAPTATRASAGWRLNLAKYAELRDFYHRTGDPNALKNLNAVKAKLPAVELAHYEAARARNFDFQNRLIGLVASGQFDYLLFGQDDAKPFGPHIPETKMLREAAERLGASSRIYFAEGIDQQSNVLLSRALTQASRWSPKVRVVWSDDSCRSKVAQYESKPIQQSLLDQITTSGATIVGADEEYDYTLYLNVPGHGEQPFGNFIDSLVSDISLGYPVAVADIDIGKDGTANQELFDTLYRENRMQRLLAYAGWNTAGNTMGTAIPCANVYLLARRMNRNPLERELAQREFLLHRFVNDYAYHKFTRPKAYAMIDSSPTASREETYGSAFEALDALVREDLSRYLDDYWQHDFAGQRFFAGSQQYELVELTARRVFLPWPRAYEVRLEFRMTAQPVPR